MPHALQKCSARMVPQDQQVDVASPGMISEELDLVSGFAIDKFTTSAHLLRRRNPFARCEQGGAVVQEPGAFAGQSARAIHYAEKELPQPQDFVEFGFTNTKPCCISVCW